MTSKIYKPTKLQDSIDSLVNSRNQKIAESTDSITFDTIISISNLYIFDAVKHEDTKSYLKEVFEKHIVTKEFVHDFFNKHPYDKEYSITFEDFLEASKFLAACRVFIDEEVDIRVNEGVITIFYFEDYFFEMYPDMKKSIEELKDKWNPKTE